METIWNNSGVMSCTDETVRGVCLGLSLLFPYWQNNAERIFLHVPVSTLDLTKMLNIPFL